MKQYVDLWATLVLQSHKNPEKRGVPLSEHRLPVRNIKDMSTTRSYLGKQLSFTVSLASVNYSLAYYERPRTTLFGVWAYIK